MPYTSPRACVYAHMKTDPHLNTVSRSFTGTGTNGHPADRAGFAAETNSVLVLDRDGGRAELSGTKRAVADAIWDRVRARL